MTENHKAEIEEVEAYQKDDLSWADRPDDDDERRAPGIFGYFLKRDPSPTFKSDVARMNTYDLDPVVIKRIERKVDMLIIPALAICYMVSDSTRSPWRVLTFPSSTTCSLVRFGALVEGTDIFHSQ